MLDIVADRPALTPDNLLTEFFEGDVRAWGLVVPRFGGSTRTFSLQMSGTWMSSRFVMTERFEFSDGQVDNRTWEFEFESARNFTGDCDELSRWKSGRASDDLLAMEYLFDLKVGERIIPVWFDDRMYRIDEKTVANRAVMHRFGIRLGEVNAVFRKTP
ncbi:MAG: DUF3833 family protein [Rhizobiaceae bacterium]